MRISEIQNPKSAFTMIEIALCLAIIGFALVAIIGILPAGMSVQKENREETIIDQDASVWMNAIRGGVRGFDDLTNHVLSITNTATLYLTNTFPPVPQSSTINAYTRTGAWANGSAMTPPLLLTNGFNIIGLLSTPRYSGAPNGFMSNHVVAYIRALSGPAVEKSPQTNELVLDTAFTYRMIPDILSYVPIDPNSTAYGTATTGPVVDRARLVANLVQNSSDLRLTFRWPVLPNGDVGNYRQSFRTFIGGHTTNFVNTPFFFFQPSVYVVP
jgi:type II secretory pathway pseudopilin PulG